jgi:acylphosphatase
MIARRYFITGEVQGVGYRYFATRAAARHQVHGYVRNLADGRVEAFAQGSEVQLDGFRNDLAAGPKFSKIINVEELVVEPDRIYSNFRIEQ